MSERKLSMKKVSMSADQERTIEQLTSSSKKAVRAAGQKWSGKSMNDSFRNKSAGMTL